MGILIISLQLQVAVSVSDLSNKPRLLSPWDIDRVICLRSYEPLIKVKGKRKENISERDNVKGQRGNDSLVLSQKTKTKLGNYIMGT